MVTVFLRGGLGNQMFQYAAGLSMAKKTGDELVLDTVHVCDRFPRPQFTPRTFDLADVFVIQPRLTPLSRAANAVPISGVWLGLDLFAMNFRQVFGRATIMYQDERKPFDPALFSAASRKTGPDVARDIILYGRWESEKYFADVADDVRAAFRFRHPLEGEAARLAQKICETNSVSLHVRRGDFAHSKTVQKLMGEIGASYFKKAAEYVAERVKNPAFFIFSDDIEWCKKNITLDFPITYASAESGGPQGGNHLHLMSLCKHNVITNSTFSWWGAWLNVNPQKVVVAPKEWHKEQAIDSLDVIPARWTKL